MAVVIETTLGDITVDLYLQQRPQACRNFLKLCKMKYYNFNLFHSIRSGFIAQTGDPTGEGSGGESIWGVLEGPKKRFFSGEKRPKIRHSEVGLLSMVCTDDMMVGSQFFFTLAPDLDSLDGTHCVIGEVTEGHEVLTKLNEVICDEMHRPYRDVRITHTVILDDPFVDPPGLRAPSRSPSPNPERLKGGRIAPDEDIDETEGKSAAEIQEMIEEKEAKARATILEIVGDLPDADIAPPENVLFVCKLNPVTTDDDLEIIFSRFGKIVSCEVIRDKKTGNSLQYAFIEFDNKKSCEDAYFKMDNVLIDDRRIHVDFSQSVSKMRYLGKGRGVQYLNDDTLEITTDQKDKSERPSSRDKERNRYRDKDHSNSRSDYDNSKQQRNENYNDQRTDRHRSNNKSQRDRSRSRSRLDGLKSSHRDKDRKKENRRIKSDGTGHSKIKSYNNDTENSYKSNSSYNDRKRMENISSPRRNIQYEKRKVNNSVEKSDNLYASHSKRQKRENSSSPKRTKTEIYGRHNSSERNKEKTRKCRDKSPNDLSRKRESSYVNKKSHKSQKDRDEPKTPSPILEDKNRKSKTTKDKEESKVKLKNNSKASKQKRKVSTSSSDSSSESSSSTDSSSSSSSDSDTRKKIKRRKRKPSSSSSTSSSSSSSSSDTSSNSSTSSESEDNTRKHRKKIQAKKTTKRSNK